MIGDNETNFPHKLLLTNRQVANLRKAFANHLSTDIKFSKAQLSKKIQSGGFLDRLLGPLLKTGLPLIKNVIKTLSKSVLIPYPNNFYAIPFQKLVFLISLYREFLEKKTELKKS